MEDEVFADPDALEFDLLGGMDLPQMPAGTSDKSRDQSSSQQNKQAVSGETTEAPAALLVPVLAAPPAAGMDGVTGGVPYEFDDQMFMMEDRTQEAQHNVEDEQQQRPEESDQQQGRDQAEPGMVLHLQLVVVYRAIVNIKGSRRPAAPCHSQSRFIALPAHVNKRWCKQHLPLSYGAHVAYLCVQVRALTRSGGPSSASARLATWSWMTSTTCSSSETICS